MAAEIFTILSIPTYGRTFLNDRVASLLKRIRAKKEREMWKECNPIVIGFLTKYRGNVNSTKRFKI